jgi:hypothetical protein
MGAAEQRGGAIAGVFGAEAEAAPFRSRLSEALRPDGQPQVGESGRLAYGCAGAAQLTELGEERLTCLLEGTI